MLTLQKDLDRFWVKVNKTDTCWLWIGCKRNKQQEYGAFGFEGKMYRAHIVSYRLHNTDYDSSKHVCHKCDNPVCVNPEHLFLGTRTDNMKDCVSKGRHKSHKLNGEKVSNSKLTEANVRDIKIRLQSGERICDIGRAYSFVHRSVIQRIKEEKRWKHVIV